MAREQKTEAKWAARVASWRESGQSAAAFVVGCGYAASTLKWWSYRLAALAVAAPKRLEAGMAGPTTQPKVALVRVSRAPKDERTVERLVATSVVELETIRVRVEPGVDESALRSIIAALRGGR